eukprot:9065656-Karenia_brevis.AAC.1
MAWLGEGYNEDGVPIYPRLELEDDTTKIASHVNMWGSPLGYTEKEFLEEAGSYDPHAMCVQMANFRVTTIERVITLTQDLHNNIWGNSQRDALRKLS